MAIQSVSSNVNYHTLNKGFKMNSRFSTEPGFIKGYREGISRENNPPGTLVSSPIGTRMVILQWKVAPIIPDLGEKIGM